MLPDVLLRFATSLVSPSGRRARLSTFIFHRVLACPDPLLPGEPDAAMFDSMLDWIGRQFNVLDAVDACERLFGGSLPQRAAIVTFDDGYRDNFEVALPILQRHRMTAAFFIATGYLANGTMFNDRVIGAVRGCARGAIDARFLGLGEIGCETVEDRRRAIDALLARVKYLAPEERMAAVQRLEDACACVAGTDLMMSADQVAGLSRAGMAIGGHTRSHPILRALPDADALGEIRSGRDDLHEILGEPPVLFAYPNGKLGKDFERRHCAMVGQAGFKFAFTTAPGVATAQSERFELPRFTPWDRTRGRFEARALLNAAGGSRFSGATLTLAG